MTEGRARCQANSAPSRRPVTSPIGSLKPGRARASRPPPSVARASDGRSTGGWSRGVGHGVYGAGEVHPPGGRAQPPLFLAS